jgi:hypothetical protein
VTVPPADGAGPAPGVRYNINAIDIVRQFSKDSPLAGK